VCSLETDAARELEVAAAGVTGCAADFTERCAVDRGIDAAEGDLVRHILAVHREDEFEALGNVKGTTDTMLRL
jgi:hypothetical protein